MKEETELQRARDLIQECDGHEHDIQRLRRAERRKRIEACKIMAASNLPRTKLYALVGLDRIRGIEHVRLGEIYAEVDAAGLDRRVHDGGLMSLRQADALMKGLKQLKLPAEVKQKEIQHIRDGWKHEDPECGPAAVRAYLREKYGTAAVQSQTDDRSLDEKLDGIDKPEDVSGSHPGFSMNCRQAQAFQIKADSLQAAAAAWPKIVAAVDTSCTVTVQINFDRSGRPRDE
jgi:hypothetical protein